MRRFVFLALAGTVFTLLLVVPEVRYYSGGEELLNWATWEAPTATRAEAILADGGDPGRPDLQWVWIAQLVFAAWLAVAIADALFGSIHRQRRAAGVGALAAVVILVIRSYPVPTHEDVYLPILLIACAFAGLAGGMLSASAADAWKWLIRRGSRPAISPTATSGVAQSR